jgi:hypothetical protein
MPKPSAAAHLFSTGDFMSTVNLTPRFEAGDPSSNDKGARSAEIQRRIAALEAEIDWRAAAMNETPWVFWLFRYAYHALLNAFAIEQIREFNNELCRLESQRKAA